MRFFLGTHEPRWLERTTVPLFVSRARLHRIWSRPPRAACDWALDSGGFMEVTAHGGWSIAPRDFAAEVERAAREIGRMQWAAPQDWMCEPIALNATGKTIAQHQALTLWNFNDLRSIAPTVPWAPVLQGWSAADYARHVEAYEAAGVDWLRVPVVGIGSVCRRQATGEACAIVDSIARMLPGVPLHGFGFKTLGLPRVEPLLASADSLAWSYAARRNPAREGCRHRRCSSCLPFALEWRDRVLSRLGRAHQPLLL